MKTAAERFKRRMQNPREMTAISLRIPVDVVDDLKEIAPMLGFSGYQGLIKAYIGQGLREDLERLEGSQASALTESLRKQGVNDEVISNAIAEAGIKPKEEKQFEDALKRAVEAKDRTAICRLIESISKSSWGSSTSGGSSMAIANVKWTRIVVHHVSGGSGINTYETVSVNVDWSTGSAEYIGTFSSDELKLPNYIPKHKRTKLPN